MLGCRRTSVRGRAQRAHPSLCKPSRGTSECPQEMSSRSIESPFKFYKEQQIAVGLKPSRGRWPQQRPFGVLVKALSHADSVSRTHPQQTQATAAQVKKRSPVSRTNWQPCTIRMAQNDIVHTLNARPVAVPPQHSFWLEHALEAEYSQQASSCQRRPCSPGRLFAAGTRTTPVTPSSCHAPTGNADMA